MDEWCGVVLSVRVYESMLNDVVKDVKKFTKVLIGLMEKAGWDLDLAASYVHPEVDMCLAIQWELLERDKECGFSWFCDKKYHELIHPNMESSIFSSMDQTEAVLSSWMSPTRAKVGFIVVPEFKVGCTVIQSQVYPTGFKCK
ncbi:hypothetical protein F2Q69_00039181 [Brassica cretica]|uniref:GIL1/IRKI C-terminal domain-containing protein n=1 Tax=Brassica cretica TaxID=69181 RepID=A0A8S9SHI8_BRACR|nr:hypothetical protein F2Q69_00039181 [Brassica cretica]